MKREKVRHSKSSELAIIEEECLDTSTGTTTPSEIDKTDKKQKRKKSLLAVIIEFCFANQSEFYE